MSAHDDRSPGDELTHRYREASEQDMSRPGPQVRLRVQEHARAVLEAQKQAGLQTSAQTPPVNKREAANQPRWKISMLASIALAGLTGLLALQFDRGTPEEKDIAFGQRDSRTASAPAAVPAPVPAPAAPAPKRAAEVSPTPAASPARVTKPAQAAVTAQKQATADQQESRKAATRDNAANSSSNAAEPAAASQGSIGRNRDTSAGRDSGASPSPSPFPASPPAVSPAPAAAPPTPSPRMMAPVPAAAPAAAAAPPMQRSESFALPHAASPAPGPADASSSLLQAARSGRTTDIARLVQQGAAVDSTDDAGRTPMMLAVINGHEAAVRQLLGLGARRSLADKEGLSAFDHARRLGFTGIATLLAPP